MFNTELTVSCSLVVLMNSRKKSYHILKIPKWLLTKIVYAEKIKPSSMYKA